MSTSLAGLATNFFPSAQNGFQTTLASTISSGAATVPLNSVAGYTNGQIAVFVVDPADSAKKQTFTGVIDTAGVQVTSVVWTAGTNQSHAGGATVVDYATATHISMITKGITQSLNPDGSLIGTAVRTALNQTASTGAGWTTLGSTPNTVVCNGNRSYTLTVNTTDLTGTLSPGMRLQFTRTVTAPTKCTSLDGSTQYYSKSSPAGMTFTNNFVVSGWVKLSSYPAVTGAIASRYNGTSGWNFYIGSTGQVTMSGVNAGAGNFSTVTSYQSLPLNKWVHVAAQLDMATFTATTTTSYVMIDGVDVPASVARGGTNPTALIQAGNLEVGSNNGGTNFLPGKIAQVAIYSAKVTQANVLATISQGLAGTETSLVSAYSFNNSINDLNANANNLTANGSAVATNTDTPFTQTLTGVTAGTTNYGIIMSVSFSTNTTIVVQVPEGGTIPTSGGVSAVSYSTQKIPYGFPGQKGKWSISNQVRNEITQTGAVSGTWYNVGSQQLSVPIGEWDLGYQTSPIVGVTSSASTLHQTLSTANNTAGDTEFVTQAFMSSNVTISSPRNRYRPLSLAAQTVYYLNDAQAGGTTVIIYNMDNSTTTPISLIEAVCAYL